MDVRERTEFRVLGPLEVTSHGESVALGPPKQRALLAILLLHAGEIVPTDRLIELLWGERPPRTAAHSIQIYVSDLRRILARNGADGAIVTRPPGYVLQVDPESIDARRFERLLAEGARDIEAGDAPATAEVIRAALDLWTGPPLADFTYEEFAQEEIRRLEQSRIDALEELAAAELARGREDVALPSIEAAIAADPLRERPRELQMLALYRAGRHAEALRCYQRFSVLLARDLGLEPSPSLQRLQERVLIHDPSLATAVAGPTPAPAPIRNPYKGLRPFGEEDAADFFGREGLVAELVDALAAGTRLVALVGPSGSGKSSVIHAGLLPALRSGVLPGAERWVIARMMPGQQPFEELAAALRRAAPATRAGGELLGEGDAGLLRAGELIPPVGGRLLLIVDQFEELFSFGDEANRMRFLRSLTTAVTDTGGRVSVVLAVRADFYDRPLLHSGFATVFARGVLNVVPMTAEDIESAVVMPARRVGVEVDPALLAQLVADTADQPGALPLLQYTLTGLFDRRADDTLTLEDYRGLGGLVGALSRRAEEVYARLADDRRGVTLQVFLRLVRLSEGARHVRRRVPLHELTALDLDPVALSEVLDAFGRHRLLSFDRDPVEGRATVEVAHEALFDEWKRLAGWIDRHRADLRQHASLVVAADEWEAAGRNPDYLLIGQRLAEYEAWSSRAALRLTATERAFVDAGIARRRAEEAEGSARREQQRKLERRARSRLWALLGTIAALAAAATFGFLSWLGSGPPDVVLLFEGTGDFHFGDMAAEGFGRAVSDFGLDAETRIGIPGTPEAEAELRRLSEEGVDLVVVGFGALTEPAVMAVAMDHPETRYVTWEAMAEMPPNVTNLTFRSNEGAFLAGAAAALKSETGVIGFVGAFPYPLIDAYRAGYEAGAREVDGNVEVRSVYLSDLTDIGAIDSRALGTMAADGLYSEDVDVILAVGSSVGVFQAAHAASEEQGRHLWAIGVDTDEYRTVLEREMPDGIAPADLQEHILTSVTKRLDLAFYAVLADYADGTLAPGPRSLGLAEGGVDIAWSGAFLDDSRPELDVLRARIIAGDIEVPTVPVDDDGSELR